jgi:hypothetical protein
MVDESGYGQDHGIIAEVQEELPLEEQLKKIIDENKDAIIPRVKWQKKLYDSKNGKENGQDNIAIEKKFVGLLRGDFAERLSDTLQLPQCDTVFSTDSVLPNLTVDSFKTLYTNSSKGGLLRNAVYKSMKEEPPTGIKRLINQSVRNFNERKGKYNELMQEIREGYAIGSEGKIVEEGQTDAGEKVWEGHPGILYEDSVIPDGVLFNDNGELAGFTEVKGYTPEEFDALLKELNKLKAEGALTKPSAKVEIANDGNNESYNLGAEIFEEIKFIDHLRRVGYGQQELSDNMQVVLRFPNDISDDALKEYGDIIESFHLPHVIIQKLPLSSAQLSEAAKIFLQENEERIKKENEDNHTQEINGGANGTKAS